MDIILHILAVCSLFSVLQCTPMPHVSEDECPCEWDDIPRNLNCDRKGLSNVPKICWDNHPNINKLSIKENALMTLVPSDFDHKNLLNVSMFIASNNNIKSIDENVFKKMPNLHWIDLSYNHLTILPESTISEVHGLQYFDISYNSIDILGPSMFSNINKLKVFNMNYNFISVLPNLDSLTQLNRLSAPYNRIASVPSLTHMVDLEYLNLNYNELMDVPSRFIPASSNKMDIHLDKNPFMTTIPASSVLPAPSESSLCLDEGLRIYATQEESDEMLDKNWEMCNDHHLIDAIIIVP